MNATGDVDVLRDQLSQLIEDDLHALGLLPQYGPDVAISHQVPAIAPIVQHAIH